MAEENRRMSEQFGDLEYEYDLLDHLDPIARAGFDPSRVRVGDPNDRMTTDKSHYQPVTDMITINPRDLASKRIHAHEFRERGIDILLEELRRDSIKFIQKYGRDFYLKLSDLRDAIKSQNRRQMIEDGEYNKNFEEMISEFYEKHEDVNQGAEYYAGEIFNPKFGFVLGKHSRDTRIPTPAEKMALLKEHQRKTGTPIVKYVFPPDTAQEQRDRLETDNQVAFREYLKTNPADRVERVFFKTPYAEGERRRTRPLFKSVELLSQFAEEQNKEYGVRDPENFAQGGEVMQGIGTLNETARNMFRGPRGIGAYQQFAGGEIQQGPAGGEIQQGSGLGQYGQYLEQTYGNPEFDQKRDNFLREIGRKEQQTFGGFNTPEPPSFQTQPATPLPFGPPSSPQFGSSSDLMNNPFLKQSRDILRNAVMPALYASGGEAMGPPPTRGPDPQGIGAYQQFADGGPVYMSNGGDPFAGVDFEALTEAVIQTESGGDPNAVSVDDAIGLMQILPSTAAQPGYENYGAENVVDIAIDMGFPVDEGERTVEKARQLLFDPEVNMAFGKKYLQAMISHSDGDIKAALQKYNAGTGNYQAFIEGRKPLDQEAVKYPITVAKFLRSLMSPEAQEERALRRRAYEEDYTTPEPAQSGIAELLPSFKRAERDMTVMASDQSVGEQLRQDFQPYFGSESQQDDFELLPPTPAPAIQQPSGLMEKYSAPNMAERLLGKKPRIKPKLRPPEVEFGEDKGGVFRSLMPPRRKQKEYPRNDPDALFRGLGKIRGRTLRKGFTPYVQDVRGELT